ncbi:hypothetical protein Tco_0899876 [Tanacetum coccineum]
MDELSNISMNDEYSNLYYNCSLSVALALVEHSRQVYISSADGIETEETYHGGGEGGRLDEYAGRCVIRNLLYHVLWWMDSIGQLNVSEYRGGGGSGEGYGEGEYMSRVERMGPKLCESWGLYTRVLAQDHWSLSAYVIWVSIGVDECNDQYE